jgi:hypothetical protein
VTINTAGFWNVTPCYFVVVIDVSQERATYNSMAEERLFYTENEAAGSI